MLNWLIYGMVFLGSALMMYNIYGYIRYARDIQREKGWEKSRTLLYIPIMLLVMFLLGYLAVGIFGKPDLIVSGILFGGSVFVFIMYRFLCGVTRRIRENEQMEARLMAAELSNRAKTEFLSSISHEMRTPMNAILGLNAIALQDDLKPATRDRLEKIDVSARHLLELINDVLDINDIESGEVVVKKEPFSLRETLELTNLLIQARCDEKGLEYRCETAEGLEDMYIGDDLRLKQALLSVLDNAVKFTPAPGTVSFTAEQTSASEGRRELRFTVRDTGIGMDADFIPKLFTSFVREDASATDRYGGSGLGLFFTKELVEQMDGTIDVISKKGEGSVFVITVTLGEAEQRPAGEAQRPDLRGRRVLIVEDIDLNAEILADLLDLEEIASERAENGQIAVEMFSRHPAGYYDAIMMDLRMPVMDGLTATRTIRALDRPDARSVPIITLTANALEEDVRQSMEAGMNAYLSKPADIEHICETLAKFIK